LIIAIGSGAGCHVRGQWMGRRKKRGLGRRKCPNRNLTGSLGIAVRAKNLPIEYEIMEATMPA